VGTALRAIVVVVGAGASVAGGPGVVARAVVDGVVEVDVVEVEVDMDDVVVGVGSMGSSNSTAGSSAVAASATARRLAARRAAATSIVPTSPTAAVVESPRLTRRAARAGWRRLPTTDNIDGPVRKLSGRGRRRLSGRAR